MAARYGVAFCWTLRSRRQKLVEMPAPPRRVFTLAIPAREPIEDGFDPAADAIAVSGLVAQIHHFHDEARCRSPGARHRRSKDRHRSAVLTSTACFSFF